MKLNGIEEIIGGLERGQLAVDLANTVKAVVAHLYAQDGGKGSVTLKLDFAAKGDMVSITGDITHKLPKQKRRQTSYFMTEDGFMSTKHPDQVDMFPAPAKSAGKTIDA